MYKKGYILPTSKLRYHLGHKSCHSSNEAEAIGLLLEAHLLHHERNTLRGKVIIYSDNQGVIRTAAKPRAKSSQFIFKEFLTIMEETSKSSKQNRQSTDGIVPIQISWISAHSDIQGNEMADGEAKLAAMGKTSTTDTLPHLLCQPLLKNGSALKQEFHKLLKARWKTWWRNSSHHDKFSHMDNQFPFSNFNKARDELMRKQASLIMQIRTEHVPVNRFLHRIKKRDNPKCDTCLENFGMEVTETIRPFLFECRAYERE